MKKEIQREGGKRKNGVERTIWESERRGRERERKKGGKKDREPESETERKDGKKVAITWFSSNYYS